MSRIYLRNIVYFICALLIAGCSLSENSVMSASTVQIVGRVTEFHQHNVSTRALKTNDEVKVSCIGLFIFDNNNKCVNFQFVESSRPVFVIDRNNLSGEVSNAKVYIVTNVPSIGSQEWIGEDLSTLLGYAYQVDGIDVPVDGFPMVGSLEGVNLENSATNLASILEIPLTNLFAKIVFNIQVNTDQTVAGYIPSYNMTSWEVHNLPEEVAFALSEQTNANVSNKVISSSTYTGNNPVSGSNTLSFYFYMPECKTLPKDFTYPSGIDDNEKQRFKPLRIPDNKKPSFVRLKGTFTDHQGHMRNISHDIYLGLDNWQDFQVIRNYQYNNNVVIRGATNSVDGKENTISIDHRVNVESSHFSVAMERETMLDCHFEVRPIRIKLNDGGKVVAKVDSGCNWIRLERKNSSSNLHCANGKRKYFTSTLMNELSSSVEVTSNEDNCIWAYVDENTNIAEAKDGVRTATITLSYYANETDQTPTMVEDYTFCQRYLYPIKVDRDGNGTIDATYYIEYYEEYLHDFDSDNDFNQTDYEGMEWGMDGLQISNTDRSIFQKSYGGGSWLSDIIGDIMNGALANVSVFYDFYLSRDKGYTSEKIQVHDYDGYRFNQKIISVANASGNANYIVGELALDEKPKSAIEYCYNKNKRDPSSHVANKLNWYLPSIDEMEDIVKSAYTVFDVFQENYYWSSQPAYKQNKLVYDGWLLNSEGVYFIDNVNTSRATKVEYSDGVYSVERSGMNGYFETLTYVNRLTGSDSYSFKDEPESSRTYDGGYKPRTSKHRIRAVYKPE